MRRLGRLALLTLATVWSAAWAFADASLELSISRDNLYLGESLILEVKVGGSAKPDTPDLSAIANCRVEFLGSQDISHQSIVIINGQMRREGFTGRTFHYKVTPTREGRLTLGPVNVLVDGTTLSDRGPSVVVTGVEAQNLVSIKVSASRDAVLVDEPFDIRFSVRILKLPGSLTETDPLFRDSPPHLDLPFVSLQPVNGLQTPDIRQFLNQHLVRRDQTGFAINDYTVQPDMFDFDSLLGRQDNSARFKFDRKSIEADGQRYWEYGFTLTYVPLNEGTYTFGPILFKGQVPTAVHEDGSADRRQVFAVGPAAIVRVVPPPERDRPDSYIGAIGSGLTAEASLDAQTCNVGDPLALTLSISGPIQIRNVTPPKLGLQPRLVALFETYDDTVKTSRKDRVLTYTYTIRPRQAGPMELPPIDIAYYDTSNREYRVVSTAPIPLKVRQASEVTASQIIGVSTNQPASIRRQVEVEMVPAGIRMTMAGAVTTPLTPNLEEGLLLLAVGPLVFVIALILRTLYRRRHIFLRSRRRRRALSVASHHLRQASRNPATFHAAACQAFREYLEWRLGIPAASITPTEARSLLIGNGVTETAASAYSRAMQDHFDCQFTTGGHPAASMDPTPSIAAIAVVDATLNRLRANRAPGKLTGIVLASVWIAGSLHAAPNPDREFVWNEANVAMATAKTPSAFLDAAATYQKLVDMGVRNADLFFNQGTALLLAGKYDDAAAVLRRAERFAGSESDIKRNLGIARGRAAGLNTPLSPWSHVILFWHYGLPCSTRATIAAIAFTAIWVAALLRLGKRLHGTLALLWTAVLVCALAVSSVITTITQEAREQRPVSLRALPTAMP